MKKGILRNASVAGALTAGAVLMLGSGAAQAAPDQTSAGNQGIGNGTQVLAPIQVPVDICGNAVAVLGAAGAGCQGGSSADLDLGSDDDWADQGESAEAGSQRVAPEAAEEDGGLGDQASVGNNGVLNGTQAEIPVQVPIDACGNAVGALIGVAGAGCQGGSSADLGDDEWDDESAQTTEAAGDGGTLGDQASVGNNGILNGTQAQIPVQIPVDICGNAVAVAGVAGAGCQGGSSADMGESGSAESAQVTEASTQGGDEDGGLGDQVSAGNNGILNGTQLQVPVQVPVDVSGNAIGVLGVAGAGSQGGSSADLG